MSKEEIEKIALQRYPKVGEWNGDVKDWIDGNWHLRRAFMNGMIENASQYKAKVEELEKELKRKQIEWKNQRDTICNFHDVYKKHFGLDDMACSQNLDEKLTSLKQEKERLVEALEGLLSLCQLEDRTGRLVVKEVEKEKALTALSSLSKQNK